jgi:hypothetical protein
VYGFTMSYRFTRLPLHLDTARRCANYFLDKLEQQVDDSVALWDFSWPGDRGPEHRDASASVVVASALLELGSYLHEERWHLAAQKIMQSVNKSADAGGYLGDFAKTQGVLVHGTVLNPAFSHGAGQDVSLIYADYYALEAWVPEGSLAGFWGGACLRSGRPRGPGKAFQNVGGFAPHISEGLSGPPGPARLPKRTQTNRPDCLQVPRGYPPYGGHSFTRRRREHHCLNVAAVWLAFITFNSAWLTF